MRGRIHYEAEQGVRRIVRRFLWWPLVLDGEWRWLETAMLRQHFLILGRKGRWVSDAWMNMA